MRYRILVLFLSILSSSCDSTKYLTIDNQQYEVFTGPGLMRINENLYSDETEVTNVMYLEFIDWTEEIFGKNSNEFERIQVDKSVWNNTKFSIELGEKTVGKYKKEPLYSRDFQASKNLQINCFSDY